MFNPVDTFKRQNEALRAHAEDADPGSLVLNRYSPLLLATEVPVETGQQLFIDTGARSVVRH